MRKRNRNNTRHRSAVTGRFVTKRRATNNPKTTLSERIGGGSTFGVHRSAVTGKFVRESYAKRNPRTTIRDN